MDYLLTIYSFRQHAWNIETEKPIEKKAAKIHKRNENDNRSTCAPQIQTLAKCRFEKKTQKRHTRQCSEFSSEFQRKGECSMQIAMENLRTREKFQN
ncbi:hypothetical protein T10_1294 [Trichinella papuae]|uniref:Uncharacterized protein n=1 Tax=Trichinella papuae TaxID=268474 RepID=A0A0V1N0T0_9BILA|nr:hypothetical protein T10_1294 [Trichinella papuae]